MNTHQLEDLKAAVSGKVAVSGDAVYEKASKMFTCTVQPGAVVRPESSNDVAAVVRFAKGHHIPLAIRSGGHSNIASRLAKGVLLIDLSGLASVEVIDPSRGWVRIGGGALWRGVARELEKHGLGISSGDTGSVGVGGLSTGAGIGWMVRKYGPLVDNMVAAEVVTADGTIVQASETENTDLFWAIRGGGSNFGVVTSFTFKAHPVAGVFFGSIVYPLKNTSQVLKGWRDAMRQAPAELTTMLLTMPPMGDKPASIVIMGCFEGTNKAAADQAFAPFLGLGELVKQDIKAMPYEGVLAEAMYPPNTRVIGHSTFIKEFSDDVIETIDELCRQMPPILQIRHVAGAMGRLPVDATAFSHRDCEVLLVNPAFVALDANEEVTTKALSPWRALEPFGEGPYLNLDSEDTGKEVLQAYLPATLERLRKIKAQYDPDNIFNANYNIVPS